MTKFWPSGLRKIIGVRLGTFPCNWCWRVSKCSVRARGHSKGNNQSTYCHHASKREKKDTRFPRLRFLHGPQQGGPDGVLCRQGNRHADQGPHTNASCLFMEPDPRRKDKGYDWDWQVPSLCREKHLSQGSRLIMRSLRDLWEGPQVRPQTGGLSMEAPRARKPEWVWALPTWSREVDGGREAEFLLTTPPEKCNALAVRGVWREESSSSALRPAPHSLGIKVWVGSESAHIES